MRSMLELLERPFCCVSEVHEKPGSEKNLGVCYRLETPHQRGLLCPGSGKSLADSGPSLCSHGGRKTHGLKANNADSFGRTVP